jgi:hypothetical protein
VTSAETADATSAKATDAASAETADVTSAEATHMASAKAAHMASTAATSMATAAAAAATAGLRVSGKKAAGKHCTCQNHHHSSSHDILLLGWAGLSATGSRQTLACAKGKRQRRDGLEVGMLVCPLY